MPISFLFSACVWKRLIFVRDGITAGIQDRHELLQLFEGADTQFVVDVLVVEAQGTVLDVQLLRDLPGAQPGGVAVKDAAFVLGQGGDARNKGLEGIGHRLVAAHVRQPGQLSLHLLAFQLQLIHPPPGLLPVFLKLPERRRKDVPVEVDAAEYHKKGDEQADEQHLQIAGKDQSPVVCHGDADSQPVGLFLVQTADLRIDEIKGVYVPFWLFDSDADAQLRFTATRTRSWSDNKYDYTETNYYSVRRDGTLGFDTVPVDGSSKIEDDLMESIEPFAMQDSIPFQTAYLAGYVADKYDVSAEESIERANKRIRRSTEETFQQTVTGYDSVKVENSSIQLHGGKAKYALFPVWLLSTSWRGENYLFAMNGQTGRFVGDLPVDKGAARKWMLGLTAALSAASYGVMWLLWLARIL